MIHLKKRLLLLLLSSSLFFISCSPFKIREEVNKLTEEKETEISKDGDWLNLFVYFENSMKGEKIFIKSSRKVYFDGVLNQYSDVGIADWFKVSNVSEIELKINDKEFIIKGNKVLAHRYLIISKKSKNSKQYQLTFTNTPKAYL